MPVIGTAGHVDHGKSTLVFALTGRDPDRFEEEKRRGLTIDLGFAWTTLPSGVEVSFVDVPGHERFMKNMLAGIEAIDVALLVVAADEGWKPQSEEHLAVLDLLEVRRGVVALTKVDRVAPEVVDLATLEVEEKLAGTTLEGSAVVPVAAPAGVGLDMLRRELAAQATHVEAADIDRPRLWIDRAFVIAGAGAVVTGTLLDGPLRLDDRVAIWPGLVEGRVRGLQSHEHDVQVATPRRRTAVNLAGIERERLARGAMLGRPGDWAPTREMAVAVRPARYLDGLPERGAFHLHLGSGAWPVEVKPVEDGLAVLRLPQPLTVAVGDRFILRDAGRRLVVGGGRVLDPAPRGRTQLAALARLPDLDPDQAALALLDLRGRDRLDRLAAHTRGGRPAAPLVTEGVAWSENAATELAERAEGLVAGFHADNPLRPGIPLASLASLLDVPLSAVERLVDLHASLRRRGAEIALASFGGGLSTEQEEQWQRMRQTLERAGWAPPRLAELAIDRELLAALVRRGDLVKVSDDLAYLPSQLDLLAEHLHASEGSFTVSAFKDGLGITRKHAVPLLEWADRAGVTVRTGDVRRVRR